MSPIPATSFIEAGKNIKVNWVIAAEGTGEGPVTKGVSNKSVDLKSTHTPGYALSQRPNR